MGSIRGFISFILELFWNCFGTPRDNGLVQPAGTMGYKASLIQHSRNITAHYIHFSPSFRIIFSRYTSFYINNFQRGFGTPNMIQRGATC